MTSLVTKERRSPSAECHLSKNLQPLCLQNLASLLQHDVLIYHISTILMLKVIALCIRLKSPFLIERVLLPPMRTGS